jgi:hypothetical protein
MFRDYLISLIRENKGITENELLKKAFMEKGVKPETTRKYLRELKELKIV